MLSLYSSEVVLCLDVLGPPALAPPPPVLCRGLSSSLFSSPGFALFSLCFIWVRGVFVMSCGCSFFVLCCIRDCLQIG